MNERTLGLECSHMYCRNPAKFRVTVIGSEKVYPTEKTLRCGAHLSGLIDGQAPAFIVQSLVGCVTPVEIQDNRISVISAPNPLRCFECGDEVDYGWWCESGGLCAECLANEGLPLSVTAETGATPHLENGVSLPSPQGALEPLPEGWSARPCRRCNHPVNEHRHRPRPTPEDMFRLPCTQCDCVDVIADVWVGNE